MSPGTKTSGKRWDQVILNELQNKLPVAWEGIDSPSKASVFGWLDRYEDDVKVVIGNRTLLVTAQLLGINEYDMWDWYVPEAMQKQRAINRKARVRRELAKEKQAKEEAKEEKEANKAKTLLEVYSAT